jgi:hypothetical protein
MIKPITRDKPFKYVRDLCFSNEPPLIACVGSKAALDGAPIAVYPAAEVDSGKRFEAKSKADDTEYDLSWRPARSPFAAEVSVSGSSSEKESFLEDGVLEAEEETEVRREGSVEDAREANSRESRGGRYDISQVITVVRGSGEAHMVMATAWIGDLDVVFTPLCVCAFEGGCVKRRDQNRCS